MANEIQKREDLLFKQVSELIEQSRQRVKKVANTTMVYTYYGIGKYIVEDEQQGSDRAEYGKSLIKGLSSRLTERYGKGWSVETLKKCRKFYTTYRIRSASQTQSEVTSQEKVCNADPIPHFTLSWNHYQILMRIENPNERRFYETHMTE